MPDHLNDAEPQIGRGERQSDDSHGMDGIIDDFRIYGSSLSSSEIKKIYNGERMKKDLIGRWNFESGNRETAYDTSNFGHEGVLSTESLRSRGQTNISTNISDDTTIQTNVALSSWYKTDQLKFGDGSDGDVHVSSQTKIDEDLKSNTRSYADAVNYVIQNLRNRTIDTFSTPNGVSSEDLVMVANLQGTTSDYGEVGNYEFLRVQSVNLTENRIILEDRVSEGYGDPMYQNVVVQRVPEYRSLTIDGGELTVSDWGTTQVETCPSGWTHNGGECYKQVASDNWGAVRSQCRDYGGELARIDSSSTNTFISDNYPDSWIGFRDISGPDDGGNDGEYEWVWTKGDYYNYKNFASGEPSIGGVNNNPAVRIGSGGSWYTEYGQNNTYPGVCEMNKKKGGVLAFKASDKVSTLNGGIINATGKGYRGGDCSFCGDDSDGRAGEGIAGTGKYGFYGEVNNFNGGAGAGVNDNDGGDPAGGGGYGTAGEASNKGHDGGISVGSPELENIYFGGGGGSGSDNDNNRPHPEDSHGGGIIFIQTQEAQSINLSNQGIDGKTDCDVSSKAQSGGGAGGTVYVASKKAEIQNLNASGGAGIYDGEDGPSNDQCLSGERSGDGGQGRIRINSISESYEQIQPNPFNTSLRPNLVGYQGEYGIGGYQDIVFGNINNRSTAFTGLSKKEKWRNVALDFNGDIGKLYLDGEEVGSFDKNSLKKTEGSLKLAKNLRGLIDEARVYNRTLNSEEISRLAFR